MIVIIQCAASKSLSAGQLQQRDGQNVYFVANPERAPIDTSCIYAHPDSLADTGNSWRDELIKYNTEPKNNPLGLLPAWELYENETYALLAERFGSEKLFILSAGWGLIAADFLTPSYDITFSAQADSYKRRKKNDRFNDLCMLPADTDEPVVFFVSKGYIPLALALTKYIKSPRHLFYRSQIPPEAPGCVLSAYKTRTRTNWHYECAKSFLTGNIEI